MDADAREMLLIALSTGMAVLIWLVQLVIYPAFADIRPERFVAWHRAYTGRIAVIVAPCMCGQAGLVLWRLIEGRHDAASVALAVGVAAAWIGTFAWSVPCHGRLQQVGQDAAVIRRLVRTNGMRTAAWSLAAAAAWVRP